MTAKKDLRSLVRDFPDSSGVYVMLNTDGVEIYIGKAKSLRKRVSSYLRPGHSLDDKTMALMENTVDISYTCTDSEMEALLLESRLIREIKPKFNIDLKWGQRYPSLVVVKTDDFAQIMITRDESLLKLKPRQMLYSGMFTEVTDLRSAVDILQKIFRYRTCKLVIQKDDKRLRYNRPCLLYHIRRCSGPCAGKITATDYHADIRRFIDFIRGKKTKVVRQLKKQMQAASEQLKYENAARLRDEIELLKQLSREAGSLDKEVVDVPLVDPEDSLDELQKVFELEERPLYIDGIDMSHLAGEHRVGSVVTFINGMPAKANYRRYRIKKAEGPDDVAMISEVVERRISRLLKENDRLPDILLIDGGKGQVNAAQKILDQLGVGTEIFAVGLAKREEILFPAGAAEGIALEERSPGRRLLCYVRDEAHRFARLYHHLLRDKQLRED